MSESKVFSVAQTTNSVIPRNVPSEAWNVLGVAWVSYACQSVLKTCVFTLMTLYSIEFNLSPVTVMLFPALFTILHGPLAPLLSHSTDILGGGWSRRHTTMVISLIYVIAAFAISQPYISGNAIAFLILVIIIALFLGPAEPLVCAMAADWFPMESRGFALGFHHTGFPWGAFLAGQAISVILASYGDANWRLCFLLLAVPTVVVIWWFRYSLTLKTQHKLVQKAKMKEVHITITDEKLPDKIDASGAILEQEKVHIGEAFRMTIKNPTAFATLVTGLLTCGSYWVWVGWLPLYIYNIGGYSASMTASFAVFFALTGGCGQIFWGSLSDRIGRKLSMLIICGWTIAGYFLMQYSLTSVATLIGFQLLIGCVTNSPFPLVYALIYDVSDIRIKGVTAAFADISMYAGALFMFISGVLIKIGGGFLSPTGYMWTLYMMMGLYGIAFFCTLLFARETKGWFYTKDFSIFPRSMSNIPEPKKF